MRRLRVLSEHPHLGRPNDVVREIPNAQAYVDAGFCEWVDPPESSPGVVDRAQPPETTTAVVAAGEVEVTSPRPTTARGVRAGARRKPVDTAPHDVTP